MAGIQPGTQGQAEYRYLIDFVKAGQSVKKEKKQNLEIQSSVSGNEARLFYEELCEKTASEIVTNPDEKKTVQVKRHKERTRCNKRGSDRKSYGDTDSDSFHQGSSKKALLDWQASCKSRKGKTADRGTECSPMLSPRTGGSTAGSVGQLSQRIVDHRKSELLRLAQDGDTEGVKLLLQQGVDVNSVDQFGWTASMAAAFEGHLEVLESLVESGADLTVVNSQGQTALTLAQQKRRTCVINFIESYKKLGFIPSRSRMQAERQPVSFYCDVCKAEFRDTDEKSHTTSVVHIFNSGSKPKDDSFLVPLSNAGFRIMMKSGWNGNTGLGPGGQGQKFPVKTLLKRDRKGFGNEVTDKPKVTHFKAKDKAAVSTVPSVANKREANVRTLSRRAQRAKERRDRRWEINIRRELS